MDLAQEDGLYEGTLGFGEADFLLFSKPSFLGTRYFRAIATFVGSSD